MSENQPLDYYEVEDVLGRAGAGVDPSDCHGLLAGLVCATGFADPKVWVAQIFDDYDPRDANQSAATRQLGALSEDVVTRLNSENLDFQLLLPDDEDALAERAASLGSWCGGFLSGLGLGGISGQVSLPDAVGELLEDLAQIARVDFEVDETDEQEQHAFADVVEYVRIGVLLINEELQPGKVPPVLQ
jgi:yecA family protein